MAFFLRFGELRKFGMAGADEDKTILLLVRLRNSVNAAIKMEYPKPLHRFYRFGLGADLQPGKFNLPMRWCKAT